MQQYCCPQGSITNLSDDEYTRMLEELLPKKLGSAKACDTDEYDRILRVFLHELEKVIDIDLAFFVDDITQKAHEEVLADAILGITVTEECFGYTIEIPGKHVIERHALANGRHMVTLDNGRELCWGLFYRDTDAEYLGCYLPEEDK